VTLAGVAVQLGGWGLHTHFNHNDIYHLVQMAGLYCLYRGALKLDGLDGVFPRLKDNVGSSRRQTGSYSL
jgi:hypothetical protein